MEHTDTSSLDHGLPSPAASARLLVDEGGRAPRTVLVAPGSVLRVGRAPDLELSLDDPRASRTHCLLRYDGQSVTLQDLESSNGTWIGANRVHGTVPLANGALFRVGSTSVVLLLPEREASARTLPATAPAPVMVDPATVSLFDLARRLGPTDLAVLVQGETGSGKEVVARAIHQSSPRATGPVVVVNCAVLSDAVNEPDNAQRIAEYFDTAEGGTLLLDEVGELSAVSQARLLRALQERTVGASTTSGVRVVATTHLDLAREVSAGRFREDLYFRLNGVTVDVPPLRARAKDIPALVQRMLEEHGGTLTLGTGVAAVLAAHRWPGNVRELRNALSSAVALAQGGVIKVEHLPPAVRGDSAASSAPVSPLRERVDETERKVIITALESTGWNQSRAARVLGISRRALIYKMERYGLKPLPNGQRHA